MEAKATVTIDRYTRVCLTAITVLLALLVVGLWSENVALHGKAMAADPAATVPFDSSAQRKDMLDAQQETNRKLDQLISLLRSGEVKVKVMQDESKTQGASNDYAPKPRRK